MSTKDPEQAELDALLGKPQSESSKAALRQQAEALESKLQQLPEDTPALQKAGMMLDLSGLLVAQETKGTAEDSWRYAREAFDIFLEHEAWSEAVKACDMLFEADQPASVAALANGTWLAVTWPVPAEQTVRMLEHIVDDTPEKSDGAAVAAIAAHYIADIRCSDEKQHNSLTFMTRNLVASVAQRHGKVKNQQEMDLWIERLGLTEPETFLPRLGRILDLMAGDQWWYDRDAIRAKLPADG
ncbi:MAG: hypothetical protein KDJ38_21100 [Gammaproteobacteria bacterium]|nr:hypothetical protein [Gammaproteobacteria bacterium]